MAAGYAVIGYNEEVQINSGNFATLTGTITLTSVTCTLRDSQGNIIAGCNAVPADSFISVASATPYAIYTFSASELSLAVPITQDCYNLEFLATDTLENTYSSVVCIV